MAAALFTQIELWSDGFMVYLDEEVAHGQWRNAHKEERGGICYNEDTWGTTKDGVNHRAKSEGQD